MPMELTTAAAWLNRVFAHYDGAILAALNRLAQATQGALTPFFRLVSLLAEHGLGPLLLALGLMACKRTRRLGFCVLWAVGLGALMTNVLLKGFIARPRPFADQAGRYFQWWQAVGTPYASGFSFPSGHTTATAAAMSALILGGKGRRRYWAVLPALIMGMSRNYLMVHYPSDVLAGLVVGLVGGAASCLLVRCVCARQSQRSTERGLPPQAGWAYNDVLESGRPAPTKGRRNTWIAPRSERSSPGCAGKKD